jgi:hypothetical protein
VHAVDEMVTATSIDKAMSDFMGGLLWCFEALVICDNASRISRRLPG